MPRTAVTVIVAAAALAVMPAPLAALAADPALVSVAEPAGTQDVGASGAAVSADGRYVAFTSDDPLTGVPTDGVRQLFVRDRVAGRTVLASRAPDGSPADAPVDDLAARVSYAISGDGRYVVFASEAQNLAPAEQDGGDLDVFRADLATGAVDLVSAGPGGAAANGPAGGDPDVSFDGSLVAFMSGAATNLWPGDAGAGSDVVVRDMWSRATALASATALGTAMADVGAPSLAADGRHVAFSAGAGVHLRDLGTGVTTVVSGVGADPDVSGSGRYVVFSRGGGVVHRDHATGAETVVAAAGGTGQVSADGRRVAFTSATPFAAGDDNGVDDVYVSAVPPARERVSVRASGADATGPATRAALSGNGAAVAFDHTDGPGGDRLAADDADGLPDTLVGEVAASDVTGPQITVAAPADGSVTAEAVVAISGAAADPSGLVELTVDGVPALRSPTGAFAVEVPALAGVPIHVVRARDGAGNTSERRLSVTRAPAVAPRLPAKARVRGLRVVRVKRVLQARFTLSAGATRVVARLWRRVVRRGAAPAWTPATPPRRVSVAPGARRVTLLSGRLRADVYQLRVTVVSPGGVVVGVLRHREPVAR